MLRTISGKIIPEKNEKLSDLAVICLDVKLYSQNLRTF